MLVCQTKKLETQLDKQVQNTPATTSTKLRSNQRTKGISKTTCTKIKSLKLLPTAIESCSKTTLFSHITLFYTIALVRF